MLKEINTIIEIKVGITKVLASYSGNNSKISDITVRISTLVSTARYIFLNRTWEDIRLSNVDTIKTLFYSSI